jgi:hypothetical protein
VRKEEEEAAVSEVWLLFCGVRPLIQSLACRCRCLATRLHNYLADERRRGKAWMSVRGERVVVVLVQKQRKDRRHRHQQMGHRLPGRH